MKFNFDFHIGLDDLNVNGDYKNTSILSILENSAGFHCDSVGGGLKSVSKTGKAWILLDWQVKILRRPQYGETLKVSTWGRKVARLHVLRDYEVYADGQLCIQASSKWAHLDLTRRMPVRINEEEMIPYDIEDQSVLGIDEIQKLLPLDSYNHQFKYTVRNSDIDINGHLHNTNYLDIICEELDKNILSEIKDIRISYKKEIAPSATVVVKQQFDQGKYYFAIVNEDDTVIHALAELS